jgi:hypothetical protein
MEIWGALSVCSWKALNEVHQGGFVIFSHMVQFLIFFSFFLSFFLFMHNSRPNKQLATSSEEAHWQRASMSFTSTPLGFKPKTFFKV